MKKFWTSLLILTLFFVPALRAGQKKVTEKVNLSQSEILQKDPAFKVGVRYVFGVWAATSVKGQNIKSEFTGLNVVEPYIEWKPLSWLGIELGGQIGNSTAYDMGDVTEMTMPTFTLKTHPFRTSWIDIYAGAGIQYSSVSGSYQATNGTKAKYEVSGGGVIPAIQLGSDVTVYKGLSLGLDVKYTPTSSITINGGGGNTVVINKVLQTGLGLNYSF